MNTEKTQKVQKVPKTPKTPKEILEMHSEKRTKCIVYTRVMGYHRPVESFNIGKIAEHEERKKFREELAQIVK